MAASASRWGLTAATQLEQLRFVRYWRVVLMMFVGLLPVIVAAGGVPRKIAGAVTKGERGRNKRCVSSQSSERREPQERAMFKKLFSVAMVAGLGLASTAFGGV